MNRIRTIGKFSLFSLGWMRVGHAGAIVRTWVFVRSNSFTLGFGDLTKPPGLQDTCVLPHEPIAGDSLLAAAIAFSLTQGLR